MERSRSGSASSCLSPSQTRSTTSSSVASATLGNCFSRKSSQIWSTGLTSGLEAGGAISRICVPHHEVLRLLPARLIRWHHDAIRVERLTDRHEKERHQRRRGPRQHQGRHLPLGGRHSGRDIGLFPDHLARRTGPHHGGCPAPPGNADPTTTGLLCRHLQDGALVLWSTGGHCRLDQSRAGV
jgi:hypothetical protein